MKIRNRRYRVIGVLAIGVAIAAAMTATPAAAHVGGTVAHLWNHLKPLADARYVNVGEKASDSDKLDGLDSSDFAPAGAESWNEVTSFAFSRWENVGGSWASVGFYKDPYGVVHLKGTAKAIVPIGSCTVIFYLPSGYAPSGGIKLYSVPKNGAYGGATGVVTVDGASQVAACGGYAVNDTVSLDGITFRAG
jgi:hypothetical protein